MSDNNIPSWDETDEMGQEVPKFEDTAEIEAAPMAAAESNDAVADAMNSTMGIIGGGAVGAAVGATPYILGSGVDEIMKRKFIGGLDKATMNTITNNVDAYKNAKPIHDTLEEYHDLGKTLRDGSMKAALDARASLKGKPAVPASVLNDIVADSIKNDKVTSEMRLGTKESVLANELDLARPSIEASNKELAAIQSQLDNPSIDGRDIINQKYKNKAVDNKLGQVDLKNQQKLSELEQMLATVREQNPALPVQNAKEDMLFNIDNDAT